jgi:OOP family OmpA-OmpF porin
MVIFSSVIGLSNAEDASDYYAKLYGGATILSDKTFNQTGVPSVAAGARGTTSLDAGWGFGGAIGYNINNNVSTELAWDYMTNGATTKFTDGTQFSGDGDFSSSILFVNGIYKFDPVTTHQIRPYLGVGLGYVDEIDLDMKRNGVETSYSTDGEFAWQAIAGVEYPLNNKWSLNADARYVNVSSLDLKNEAGTGTLKNVDYNPTSLMFGVTYKF